MLTVETVLGNVREDDDLAAALERHADAGTLERLEIDAADRVKSRLRAATDAGTDLGIVVDRPALRDGDVLPTEEDRMVVVRFADREAVAVDLASNADRATLVEFGHAIGNQHWDLAVEDGTAYVPLDADLRIVEDVLEDALPDGAETRVETVDGGLFVEDGNGPPDAGQADHEHAREHANDYAHGGHEHSHEHAHDGPGHSHGDSNHKHGGSNPSHHDHERDSADGQVQRHSHGRHDDPDAVGDRGGDAE